MKLLLRATVFIISILMVGESFAQYERLKRSRLYEGYNSYGIIKITGGAGVAMYYGDLCTNAECMASPSWALNFGMKFRFNDRFSLRADFNTYTIGNSKDQYEPRNLTFHSTNFELSVGGEFDILPYSVSQYSRSPITPYVYAGIGVTYFDPKATYEGTSYRLRPLQTEGVAYAPIAMVLPFGGGISYSFGSYTDISLEFGYRITTTDYLDDVSTVYKDPSSFADPIARALADRRMEGGNAGSPASEGDQRGNPDRNDGYFLASFKVEITLPHQRVGGTSKKSKSTGAHLSKMSKKYRRKMMKRRR
jgi:Domain of unknown function (DUF6089)